MAAVLAGGAGAVLSHRSAATLWRIRLSARKQAEVTVPRRRGRRPAIQFHQTPLPADELTVHDGIPVTTVARTLLDLAAVVDQRQVERAINEAEVLRLWDEVSLAALVERYPRRAGSGQGEGGAACPRGGPDHHEKRPRGRLPRHRSKSLPTQPGSERDP